jgi:hypothetical protein
MMRTGGPSRAFNNDNIDIDFLRHDSRDLAQPSPPQLVGSQVLALNMEASNHEFTIEALNFPHY